MPHALIACARLTWCLLVPALLGLLSGCQRTETPSAATPAPAVAVTVPAATPATVDTPASRLAPLGDFRLLDVALGNAIDDERRVLVAQTRFQSTDTLYLSVLGSAASNDLTLSVRWLDAAGQVVTQTEQPLPAGSASVTTFSAHHPQAWPAGHYRAELAVNGNPVDFREFDVQ